MWTFINYSIFFCFIIFIIYRLTLNKTKSLPDIDTVINSTANQQFPILARTVYLISCENQLELNRYANILPSRTADVLFLCRQETCQLTESLFKSQTIFVNRWSKDEPFVQMQSMNNYREIQSQAWILNVDSKSLTWSQLRNVLLADILNKEIQQHWQWAFVIFLDGNIQVECSLIEKFLTNQPINSDERIFEEQFRFLATNNPQCFTLFDVFLLTISPAISTIRRQSIPTIVDNILGQLVDNNIDGTVVAIHRQAVPFVLPYCSKYDPKIIFNYRSLCLFGHVVQFNSIVITNEHHRLNNSWEIDDSIDLIPTSLVSLKNYIQQTPLILRHYQGWSLDVTSSECRQKHTTLMHSNTCRTS